MEKEFTPTSFSLFTALIGTFFLFAGAQKIIGDSIAFVFFNNDLEGLKGLMPGISIFVISWLLTAVSSYFLLPKVFKNERERTSVKIGAVESSILVPVVTFYISTSFVFGSTEFDFTKDYIDIIRNLVIGTLALAAMQRFGERL